MLFIYLTIAKKVVRSGIYNEIKKKRGWDYLQKSYLKEKKQHRFLYIDILWAYECHFKVIIISPGLCRFLSILSIWFQKPIHMQKLVSCLRELKLCNHWCVVYRFFIFSSSNSTKKDVKKSTAKSVSIKSFCFKIN